MRQISSIIGMSLSAVTRLLQKMQLAKSTNQMHAINEHIPKMDRPSVLSDQEEQLNVNRFKFVTQRGFAADVVILEQIAAAIARANEKPFCSEHPSNDWVRVFRAHHSITTLRRADHKDPAKIIAESPACGIIFQGSKRV